MSRSAAQDWHEFPQWPQQDLQAKFPNLEPAGVDLMTKMFVYDPAKRLSVRDTVCVMI